MYRDLLKTAEAFGKKHNQSVQSVLTKLTVGFATRQRCQSGNSWCAYVALNPNTDVNLNQNEYVTTVLGPRYRKLVEDLGGKRSSAWKAKNRELVEQHTELKAKQSQVIRNDGRNQALMM